MLLLNISFSAKFQLYRLEACNFYKKGRHLAKKNSGTLNRAILQTSRRKTSVVLSGTYFLEYNQFCNIFIPTEKLN